MSPENWGIRASAVVTIAEGRTVEVLDRPLSAAIVASCNCVKLAVFTVSGGFGAVCGGSLASMSASAGVVAKEAVALANRRADEKPISRANRFVGRLSSDGVLIMMIILEGVSELVF